MADDGPDLSCFDFASSGDEQETREDVLKKHREDYCPGLPAAELDALAAWKVRTAQSPAASAPRELYIMAHH